MILMQESQEKYKSQSDTTILIRLALLMLS